MPWKHYPSFPFAKTNVVNLLTDSPQMCVLLDVYPMFSDSCTFFISIHVFMMSALYLIWGHCHGGTGTGVSQT